MKYQIDQSGKIEQTHCVTVLACTNDHTITVQINARVKRRLQEVFRRCGMNKLYIYYLFSVGIYFLIKDLRKEVEITIDKEYPGKEKLIKSMIEELLSIHNKSAHNILFARIGNEPDVHYAAHDIFTKKKKPQQVITVKDFVEATKKTDGRLRECLSTLVDARTRSTKKRYQKKIKKSR